MSDGQTTSDQDPRGLGANAERFSGFADLYDAVRPDPPDELAQMLADYAGGSIDRPIGTVVDLGSGTGLSSRWAEGWAPEVIGVEPNADMRRVATGRAGPGARFVEGWAHRSGLPPGCADVVLAVQAMHWMEPVSTLAEVARLLRPGGVFAAIDCDWPPSVGDARAERAWSDCRTVIRVHERRRAAGLAGSQLAAPVTADEVAAATATGGDPHRHAGQDQPWGVRSWPKDGHLARLRASGHFAWCTEVALGRLDEAGVDRFVDLLRSQGDYQTLRQLGLGDDQLGVTAFAAECARAFGGRPRRWVFSYRARIGVTAPA